MANYDPLSFSTLIDSSGVAAAGAKISYFETGSTTPKAVYSNAGLTSAITQPVTCDSLGVMPVVYLSAGRYKRTVTTSTGTTLSAYAADPIDSSQELIAASAAPSTTYAFLRYHNTSDGHVYRRDSTNSSWIDEGAVDSLGNAATVTQQLAGTATTAFCTPDSVAALWQRGSDIASASTMSLPSTGGNEFNVTGTTTITGISTAAGGRKVRFKFASALSLTHNATSFIMPGGVSVSARAGDLAEFTNEAAADATGSNWRLTDYIDASIPITKTPSSKTGNYTATDADNFTSIRFAGLSADATLTLPAASGRSGMTLFVSNEDTNDTTGWGVIVDPNASELIDGVSTRKMYSGSRVTLLCDGTGWRTVNGNWRYFSGDQTITTAGALTLAHGLGVRPKNIWTRLKCGTAEAGFSVGDVVYGSPQTGSGTASYSSTPDATNLNVRLCNNVNVVALDHKTTGTFTALTNGSWTIAFYAED